MLVLPQGSIVGYFLFKSHLNDLFFFLKDLDICKFADDTTTYIYEENSGNVLKSLEKNVMLATCWFENNYMKVSTDKCYLAVSGYTHEQLWESNDVKFLGITFDEDLKFDK